MLANLTVEVDTNVMNMIRDTFFLRMRSVFCTFLDRNRYQHGKNVIIVCRLICGCHEGVLDDSILNKLGGCHYNDSRDEFKVPTHREDEETAL
jgi:hypothetical protein